MDAYLWLDSKSEGWNECVQGSGIPMVSVWQESEKFCSGDLHSTWKFPQYCTQLGIGQLALALGFVVPRLGATPPTL